ncbi:FYVE, RhoGEF and PH domain-containing protein 4 [Nematolebias whitei]|uniref:FYVE, RhoGEF and PH domain-containing protein 4 n=1 Tax=Nematolebias whitei TaxID=451745 RepID=UPI00189744B7|nr:FYVE, RhoGEF and PH domain-containing protein 4 [Nematolebias whitei]
MFDLKKKNSLTLRSSRHEVEEFRRVAVKRRDKAAVPGELHPPASPGTNQRWPLCSHASATKPNPKPAEDDGETSPARKSSVKPEAPTASPQESDPDQTSSRTSGKPLQVNGTVQDLSPSRSLGGSASCANVAQNLRGPPSLVRGGRASLGALSPAGSAHGASKLSGPSTSGRRSFQVRSPLRGGGLSPAKLSPRNHNPLMGKLRTPSPVQKRAGRYSPARTSRSWLGPQRVPSEAIEEPERRAEKSLSVPNLIVSVDECRLPVGKVQSSLKPLRSTGSDEPDDIVTMPDESGPDDGLPLSNGSELSPGQRNRADPEEGVTPKGPGSRFRCEWTKASPEKIAEASRVEENEEEVETSQGGGSEPKEGGTEQKLFKIANELLQTERAYVARLHLLDQVFCSRLTQEADRGSFPADVIKNIFSNTSSIYSFHSQFLLPDLENCICNWSESPGLGKALLQHAPFLRMYSDYVKNFDQAMELLRTWTKCSSAFRNIIQDIQSQDVCGSLSLQHHMLEPVQRVPRYEMLLKDYLKKLPEDDPDYQLAQKSLQAISMAAIHSNSAIHKAENLKRLLEIYEMVGEEEVINPTSEFLREGRLLKLAARNTSAMERYLFLFNNFLLCCSPKFSLVGQRFTVRCRIGVDGMQVHQTINDDHPYTFQVSGKERTLELQACCEEDRDSWIKVIQEAIDTFQKKNETFKMASRELHLEDPVKELGRRAPRWIRDNEVTLCMTCREPFNSLTRRRHHCRACGYVVCWKCSDNKVALEYDGNKLNKVCKSCYFILTNQRGERTDRKKRRMLEFDTYPSPQSSVMSSYLLYGDSSMIWRRVWCVLTETETPVFYVYATPQDEKPQVTVPLLGCAIEELIQGQHCFCLRQSRTCHIFSCDDLDLKQNWLTALKLSVMRTL